MTLIAAATAAVCASLWTLDQLDVLPAGRLQTRLVRPFLLFVVVAVFVTPTAWQAGLDWFVDGKADEMLDRIRPILDELTPPSTVP